VGILNKGWGVCGFTSSLYAMYDLNPAMRPLIINATKPFRVLAEIKTYLRMLEAEASKLLDDITEFTRTFEGFADFEIKTYIKSIDDALELTEEAIREDSRFGIAMTPESVADYLERILGWSATISKPGVVSEQCVIGVGTQADGLQHYMYSRYGKIYSWGRSFKSVEEATPDWQVCCVIDASNSG
jgi:hypothetical protein